ncbi:hypothetical protein SAMN03159439_04624 [Pseudomonas sp. NFACC04-2]|nr:hypothetical protein [Pseudomonas sp. NFACC04-2]SFW77276.1 hypothetical protein SAMN03159439_04624 [Pseudomonas sp. NFACC04-2]
MSPAALKAQVAGVLALLLTAVGAGFGGWLVAGHYRPLLDAANRDLAQVTSARDNLEGLAAEQGRKLGELVQAGELRERAAALAQEKARDEARPDYAAANRILRERSGGDQCSAAETVIDQELGL